MKQTYYYFDPSQRDKNHVSRSKYTRDFFDDIIQKANTINEAKYIEGNFYQNELSFIFKNYSIDPIDIKPGRMLKSYYCIFMITPKASVN